ncbi:MAG: DUF456 domain-containing protein [Gammaproteobacteria bacterium]
MGPTEWSLIVVGALLAIGGFAGLILPALPGAPIMFLGFFLMAWAEDFSYVGSWTLTALAALAVLTYLIDFVAGLLGAQRFGASPRAMLGAAVGGIVGLFFGLPGILLGPLLGACAGQFSVVRDLRSAGRAGIGTAIGLLLGTALKVAIAFSMVGLYLFMRFV